MQCHTGVTHFASLLPKEAAMQCRSGTEMCHDLEGTGQSAVLLNCDGAPQMHPKIFTKSKVTHCAWETASSEDYVDNGKRSDAMSHPS